jgi:hypothetical protein
MDVADILQFVPARGELHLFSEEERDMMSELEGRTSDACVAGRLR